MIPPLRSGKFNFPQLLNRDRVTPRWHRRLYLNRKMGGCLQKTAKEGGVWKDENKDGQVTVRRLSV